MKNYIFIDPINKQYSGITAYTNIAFRIVSNIYKTHIISRSNRESISEFRRRVKEVIEGNFSYDNTIIESPETYSSLLYINRRWPTHIRLHGMKIVIDRINGNKIDIDGYLCDTYAIKNASYVSAPSYLIKKETEKYIPNLCAEVFPNPFPDFVYSSDKDIDVLFIGRFQKNKGVYFLNEIVSSLQDKIVYMYGEEINKLKVTHRNIYKIVGGQEKKEELLQRAKIVIIPSYFESFSQVAAEAISNGCQIVTWDSVGISEYTGGMIHSVKFGKVEEFIKMIRKNVSRTEMMAGNEFKKYIDRNNSIYLSSIKDIKFQRVFFLYPAADSMAFISEREEHDMFKRKMKKLLRDPNQFWIDSKIKKFLSSLFCFKGGGIKDDIVEVGKGNDFSRLNILNLFSKIEQERVINHHIGVNSHIKVSKINIKKRNRNTVLFMNEDNENDYKFATMVNNNCRSLNFSKDYFFEYIYKDSIELDADDIRPIARTFHSEFKDTISKFGVAIFVDPNTRFYSIIKSIFPDLKIVVVLTELYISLDVVSYFEIDMLFVHENIYDKFVLSMFRRYFVYKNEYDLCKFLDLYTNEISQKHHDMLLKVFGDIEFDTRFSNINTDIVNCIIRLDECGVKNWGLPLTWDEYIRHVSKNIKSIMVAESVFFSYKEPILYGIKNNDWHAFLLLASHDGVRFEVYA